MKNIILAATLAVAPMSSAAKAETCLSWVKLVEIMARHAAETAEGEARLSSLHAAPMMTPDQNYDAAEQLARVANEVVVQCSVEAAANASKLKGSKVLCGGPAAILDILTALGWHLTRTARGFAVGSA